ncbi:MULTISPECIES: hypothetical protein [Pontibacillus]|uniref:Uncharacterized protein n=1 Tax=Pontibacillus chungwhensis TaxID=265426 RepID=A0ABY8V0S9_9BACI|nr:MULTISPECIES: hypothetical protein [Pontibacillus]MCD5324464.1 hypothetical protein [Pontibacillus sp. HN14]WIF99243.1 hypothetical protein QNI29_06165 [Pontibacillus chungwhensis]
MKQTRIGSWTIEVDVNKTKEFYDNYHLITEDCDCDYCANYVLVCEKLPPEIKDLFNLLGIDPLKEGEVSEYMENKNGTHLYGAFYHIVGRIIEGPKLWVPTKEGSEVSSPDFVKYNGVEIDFSDDLALVPEGFPMPTIQFEIQLNIPWLLN